MPTYDYRCDACNHVLEIFQKITDTVLKDCPECGKNALRRGPGGGIGLSFKGSGFYITDYQTSSNKVPSGEVNKGCCPCGKNKESCP